MAGATRASSDSSHAPPRTVGRYELLHEIASGGMATVFLGRAIGMGGFERIVAVKCCHAHLRQDEAFVSMFLDEARLAAQIHHPNVVSTLDVGEADTLFLVMEYVEGDRLSTLIKAAARSDEAVPVSVTTRIALDALAGLHAAHDLEDADGRPLRLVHRDVSPQNVLVGADGVTRIMDFGVAKAEARATVTRDGEVKGKLGYMSPEQIRDENIDRRSDVFAAGIVLWETLTGHRLFRGDSDAAVMHKVLTAPIAVPSTLNRDVPPALDSVVMRSLERDRDHRFQSAAEFADALERARIPIATTREVSSYVQRSLTELLSERRALLREIRSIERGTAPPAEAPARTLATTSTKAAHDDDPSTVRAVTGSRRTEPRGRGATIALALGAIVAIGGVGGYLAYRRSAPVNALTAGVAPHIAAPVAASSDLPQPAAHTDAPIANGADASTVATTPSRGMAPAAPSTPALATSPVARDDIPAGTPTTPRRRRTHTRPAHDRDPANFHPGAI